MHNVHSVVYTIGHSTHAEEHFVSLLKQHGVTAVCDVRSKPYSRVNPQFNREALKQVLRANGIAYVFLGEELGARSEDASCYEQGKVQYDRLAQTGLFRKGLDRVRDGMRDFQLALMCAEKDPLECHRTILVSRYLDAMGLQILHILGDGRIETHQQALSRLLRNLKLPEHDMFRSHDEIINEAYRVQGERIAYEEDKLVPEAPMSGSALR
jgi:uncharacterized protein (DUF488 family)